jgi:hypothetical protein
MIFEKEINQALENLNLYVYGFVSIKGFEISKILFVEKNKLLNEKPIKY